MLAAWAGLPCQSGIETIRPPPADITHWKDVLINPLLHNPLPLPLLLHSPNQRNLTKTEGTHLSRASQSWKKEGNKNTARMQMRPLVTTAQAPVDSTFVVYLIKVTLSGTKSMDAGVDSTVPITTGDPQSGHPLPELLHPLPTKEFQVD